MTPIRILVVDSQPLTRRAWRSLLAAHADLEVVGEAGNLTEACEQATAKSPEPQDLYNRYCLSCHGAQTGVGGAKPVPPDHASYANNRCQSCHQRG